MRRELALTAGAASSSVSRLVFVFFLSSFSAGLVTLGAPCFSWSSCLRLRRTTT